MPARPARLHDDIALTLGWTSEGTDGDQDDKEARERMKDTCVRVYCLLQ